MNLGGGGGTVYNGVVSPNEFRYTTSQIIGNTAVLISGPGYVVNAGTIDGTGTIAGACGVVMAAGGSIINGGYDSTTKNTVALIEGDAGVRIVGDVGAVTNFGTIESRGHEVGVYLGAGGTVVNGSPHGVGIGADTVALIAGYGGVSIVGGGGAVYNYGTIQGGSVKYGVLLTAGGSLINGGAGAHQATILGATGVALFAAGGAVTNLGTIEGTGAAGRGAYLGAGSLTNGSARASGARIQGVTGLAAGDVGATVTNFGVIAGTGGTAISFSSASDTLVVEAGCAFSGAILGGGGMLVLDSGSGTISGLLAPDGRLTVSGSMAATVFQNFDTVEIGAAGSFASSGAVSIAAGEKIVDAGRLTLGAAKIDVVNAGTIEADRGALTVLGPVSGAGTAVVDGGILDFASRFDQAVSFGGARGTLELARSRGYAATISGFSKAGKTFLDLDDIAFGGGTTVAYSGSGTGGVLTVSDGTHTAKIHLAGDYRKSTFVAASDGHGGTLIHDQAMAAPAASPHRLIAAMAEAGGGAAGAVAPRDEPLRPRLVSLSSPRPCLA